jgi:hypothetical protein
MNTTDDTSDLIHEIFERNICDKKKITKVLNLNISPEEKMEGFRFMIERLNAKKEGMRG